MRDLVRGVQNLRKESGLEVSDRINLYLFGSDKLKEAYEAFRDYIASETLAVSVDWVNISGATEIEAGDENWLVKLEKV
jgi:isoleucyl-tRNA synthetase